VTSGIGVEPRLEKLLSIVTECSKWGLFARPLTQNWGRGRVRNACKQGNEQFLLHWSPAVSSTERWALNAG
jgi:hypothetical protein